MIIILTTVGVATLECAVAISETLPDMSQFAEVLQKSLQEYKKKAGGFEEGNNHHQSYYTLIRTNINSCRP